MTYEMQLMARGRPGEYYPLVHLYALGGSSTGYMVWCGQRASSWRMFGPPPGPEESRCEQCQLNYAEAQRRGLISPKERDVYELIRELRAQEESAEATQVRKETSR